MNKKILFTVGILILILTYAISTVIASTHPEPVRQHFTANECVYMVTAPETKISGKTIHMAGQVNRNEVVSNDLFIFSNANNTAVLDIFLNLETMKANYNATATIEVPGVNGLFEGRGVGHINLITGSMSGIGIFHGTGDFEGYKLWMELSPGDITLCEVGAFDVSHWDAYLIAP